MMAVGAQFWSNFELKFTKIEYAGFLPYMVYNDHYNDHMG